METVLTIGAWMAANYINIVAALIACMAGLIPMFMMIPGEQPEKALQAIVDFLSKFSKK